jgi:hypothetical protein
MTEAVGAVLSPRWPGFNPRPVDVRFMFNGVTLGHVSLLLLSFSTVSIIPAVLHAHSFITDTFKSQQLTGSLNNTLKRNI